MIHETLNKKNANFLGTQLRDQFGEANYSYQHQNHILHSTPDKLIPTIEYLKDQCNFVVLLDICGVDNLKRPEEDWSHGKRYEVVYHLLNMEVHQRKVDFTVSKY